MMEKFKIVLFLCNWGPHTAYQSLQDGGYKLPSEVKMIRIPCTGRTSKALLFKAFEMGADGVVLVGCKPGNCRYGTGTETAVSNTADIRDVLELISEGEERLQFATFLPDESAELLSFLEGFVTRIRELGKTKIVPSLPDEKPPEKEAAAEAVAAYNIHGCQDCGKCTASCPIALAGKPFSPRAIAGSVIAGEIGAAKIDGAGQKNGAGGRMATAGNGAADQGADIWSCLTCGVCYERCPSAVNFPEFIRELRSGAGQDSEERRQAHGGFFQSLMRAMASEDVKPSRWGSLPEDIRVDDTSKVLFYGGCSPYFDIFFRRHLGVDTSKILVDSLRLLNFFDITPRLAPHEKCCGHDLLWSGDKENFKKLAEQNVAAIRDMGIEELVTACPECYRTFAVDYPAFGVKTGFKVTHLYDLLEKKIDGAAVAFAPLDRKLTYQDACRLNRLPESRDLPRNLMARLTPENFEEMAESGGSALCCGNCAWTGCDAGSKALQVKRIRQAKATGSDLLVTSCPKCQIHLRCAMEDPFLKDELDMEMMDLTSVIAKSIRWE